MRRPRKGSPGLQAGEEVTKAHRKLANRRKNHTHQTSAMLVKGHRLIATEELSAANMTRSARGTVEAPGKNVAQKAGLNREILDTSPSELLAQLAYKAEEAGTRLHMCKTRTVKPSQRDPLSWELTGWKTLSEREHVLSTGRVIGRDHASGLVMLRADYKTTGGEPAWVGNRPETTTMAA